MKNLKTIFSVLIALVITTNLIGQTHPTPPKPPKATSSSTSTTTVSSNSYHTDDDGNVSISVKESDTSFKFRATFDDEKTSGVKKIVKPELGQKGLKISGDKYTWTTYKDGDKVFECNLYDGYIKIYVDREGVSKNFYESIKDLSDRLNEKIGGGSHSYSHHSDGHSTLSSSYSSHNKKMNAKRAEERVERLKIELERAKKDLERLKKN